MAKKTSKQDKKAAKHLDSASDHYKKAAKLEKKGKHEKAAQQSELARGEMRTAGRHAALASKKRTEDARENYVEANDDII